MVCGSGRGGVGVVSFSLDGVLLGILNSHHKKALKSGR
jgi:hypothetical protein